jgi:class 3 adenylate cyclase
MTLKDDLTTLVSDILSQTWDVRDGRVVPTTENVALDGGGVRLNATVLYTDLQQSSKLATDFQQKTTAKVIKAFLCCMCKLITVHNGVVTSFDGDRVMGIFLGDFKNTYAATCALKMNYMVSQILKPQITTYFTSFKETAFDISHCVGIDTSSVLAVRAGQRGSNDIIWVGRAPNLAAKLSEIRESNYSSYISDDVFSVLNKSAKYGGETRQLMWEQRTYSFVNESITVYRSNWWWAP